MDRKNWKRAAANLAGIAVLAFLIAFVFRRDYQEIGEELASVPLSGVLALLVAGVVYQCLDARSYYLVMHHSFRKFKYSQAIEVTFVGLFANMVTSSAGSIPAQSYYLHRCGMTMGTGIGLVILEYALHKASVFLYSAVMVIAQRQWLADTLDGMGRWLAIGYLACALIILALILLCTSRKLRDAAFWLINKLPDTEKWEKRKQVWTANLEALSGDARKLLKDRGSCGKVMATNFLKLFWNCGIPFLCIRLLGGEGLSFWQTQALASGMLLISGVMPGIAGMGPAEITFLLLFSPYVGRVVASSAMILYRTATYYFPFFISAVIFFQCCRTYRRGF